MQDRNNDELIIGIDASNIRGGGGITHLSEFVGAITPEEHGISKIVIWSNRTTLERLPSQRWLKKCSLPILEKGLFYRLIWQAFHLNHEATFYGCDIIFTPGGTFLSSYRPYVTMSQNLLPFEWKELRRYTCSFFLIKLLLLRISQTSCFRKANGLIFLTEYAKNTVGQTVGAYSGKQKIIPHGINQSFFRYPRQQRSISEYSVGNPFKIIYVSIINLYKHQWHVAEAVAILYKQNIPVELCLVGPAYPAALKRLIRTLERVDPQNSFIRYIGAVPYKDLHKYYDTADLCIFASSCENMPNILLEGMASGLPIACSKKGPMPEVLGDAGIYFDPELPDDIANSLIALIESPSLRETMATRSYQRAQQYSWKQCADDTVSFIKDTANSKKYSSHFYN